MQFYRLIFVRNSQVHMKKKTFEKYEHGREKLPETLLCKNTCVKMKPLGLNFDRFFHKIKWANKMGGGVLH